MHGHRTEPPAPGSPAHQAQRAVLLELVVDPPAAGDAVGELTVRLGHEPAAIAAAIDELAAVGLVARQADSVFATAAALRFEALGLVLT